MYSFKNWAYVASIAGVLAFGLFLFVRMQG